MFHHFRDLQRRRRSKDTDDEEAVSTDQLIGLQWLDLFRQIRPVRAKLDFLHWHDHFKTLAASNSTIKVAAKAWVEDMDEFCTLLRSDHHDLGERECIAELHQLLALFPENDNAQADWEQMEQLARAGPVYSNMRMSISGFPRDQPRRSSSSSSSSQASSTNLYRRVDDDDLSALSPTTLHASLVFSNLVSKPTEILNAVLLHPNSPKHLQTLLLLGENKNLIHQVPRQLFVKLGCHLNALDLSWTSITELPSSFGNLKSLRYLDVSGTPITRLPNCICRFEDMQTLRLRNCFQLLSLPKHLSWLTKLRHLDIDSASQFTSMPPGMGSLTELQTLPVFIVGKDDQGKCNIDELRKMTKLQGTLSILRLENVPYPSPELVLMGKEHLRKLELEWSRGHSKDAFKVLEILKPHIDITELRIIRYQGVKLPSWLGDPTFHSLTTVKLFDCSECKCVPLLGELPKLQILHLSDFGKVKTIFDQPVTGVLFPQLKSLVLRSFPDLARWTTDIEDGDFPMLTDLKVSYCPELRILPELRRLSSLQNLEINLCPQLDNLRIDPIVLQPLRIIDCPMLEKKYKPFMKKEDDDNATIPKP